MRSTAEAEVTLLSSYEDRLQRVESTISDTRVDVGRCEEKIDGLGRQMVESNAALGDTIKEGFAELKPLVGTVEILKAAHDKREESRKSIRKNVWTVVISMVTLGLGAAATSCWGLISGK